MRQAEFGTSWWAQRWRAVLESFGWTDRLQRGRSYARFGAVRRVEVMPGEVRAAVQGSQAAPYEARIAMRPLSAIEWDAALAALGAQAIFTAHLLAGEMPPAIEEVFAGAGVRLFPTADELATDCTCPDPASPCKHVAALYYVLGAELDRDPFLLFRLRGRDREQVLAGLRAVRAAAAGADPAPAPEPEPPPAPPPVVAVPLDAPGVDFWRLAAPLGDFRVTLARPPITAALPKRLGPPPFWHPPGQFLTLLETVYRQVTDEALRAALGDDGTRDEG